MASRFDRRRRPLAAAWALVGVSVIAQAPPPGGERGPQPTPEATLQSAIDTLGNLEFSIRMNSSRTVRRAPADQVVPALLRAVASHSDGYVRFRALVLLTGYNDPRIIAAMRTAVDDRNDRLRTVAYSFFEHHPDAAMVPILLGALEREEGEFVRPWLVRALAAHGTDPRVRDTLLVEVGRGLDYFRSAVIEALGDYRATYAIDPLLKIARLDGPLQIDSVIALGKLRDRGAMETLAELQRTVSRDLQPSLAAAICLLGANCEAHTAYLIETLRFAESNPGFQQLLRNTVTGLVALAGEGNRAALAALLDVGVLAKDPPRAPMALGAATVAIRSTSLMLSVLESYPGRDAAIDLLAEGFDMLEEDYEEERFFATVRQTYWDAADGSPTRRIAEALIQRLEF